MKTAENYIAEIKVDKANFEHIAATGKINGSLLVSFQKALKEYASQAIDEAADRAKLTTYSAGEVNIASIINVKKSLK